jgi:hypothetical protein
LEIPDFGKSSPQSRSVARGYAEKMNRYRKILRAAMIPNSKPAGGRKECLVILLLEYAIKIIFIF